MDGEVKGGLPVLAFGGLAEWEAWLEAHHATAPGVWLKLAKKGSDISTITYDQALDGALCYGWIDGQKASYDERFWLQKFTPRGKRSVWSRVNRERALELMRQGRMRPAGLARVEEARRDGRWEAAYEPPSTAAVPDDLRQALEEHPEAQAFFATLDSRNRYAILHRIATAGRPETRRRRIEQLVALLREGKKLYP